MRALLFIALAGAFVALFVYPGYLLNLKTEEPLPPVAKAEPEPPPPPPLPVPPPPPAPTAYPVDLSLEAANGVAMEATVVGRGPAKLHIIRKSDEKHFALEIGKLSPKSQEAVGGLTENHTDAEIDSAVASAAPPPPPVKSFLEKEFEKKKGVLAEKLMKRGDSTLNSSQKSVLDREIANLQAEVRRLIADIESKGGKITDHDAELNRLLGPAR